jgi:hypothetical protein
MPALDVNGKRYEVSADGETPRLWVLRDDLGLTGTKYGGGAQCGACTKHLEQLRIERMPRVEVNIVPSQEPPTGVGEPGVPTVAPAVAHAMFQLTGQRVRRLPFKQPRPSKQRA